MACSKYISTKETTNAARLSRLLLDPCTDLFRDLLRNSITEVQFPHFLRNYGPTLLSIINKDQRNLLYPKPGPFLGTYEDFDLSLLYILLRNISGIPPHQKGWGKQPDPADRSLSTNIERIREIRNTYCGHAPRVTLPERDFQRIWQEMMIIFHKLEGSLSTGCTTCTTYTNAANLIQSVTMDPEQEEKYLDIIDQKHRVLEDVKDSTTAIIKEQETIKEEYQQLRAEQHILKSDVQQRGQEVMSHLHRKEKELQSVLQEQDTQVRYKQQKQEEELKFMLQKQDTQVKSEQQRLDKEFKSALQTQECELKSEIRRQGLEFNTEQQMQKRGIEAVKERVAFLEKGPCERSNIIDNTTAILQTHKSRGVYMRTSAVDKIKEKLIENKILILTGKAGCGKTTTAYQVMLELSEVSSEPPNNPVIIHSPDEWNKVINPNQRHIVLLDDFTGSSNFDRVALGKWKSSFDAIFACTTTGQVLALIALRRNVLDEAREYDLQGFFQGKTMIDLSVDENITKQDKEEIFAVHEAKCSLKNTVDLSPNERRQIVWSDPYYGFPLTCFQFFSRREFYQLGSSYFLHPNEFLYNSIEHMRKTKLDFNEKVSYCVLCYVFIEGNIIKNAIKHELFENICEKLRLFHVHDIDIYDAIDDLNGLYLSDIKTQNKYEFSHETVLETVLVSFGQLAPDIIIKHCSSIKLHELVRTQNYESKPAEVVLKIPRRYFEDLAQRMLRGDDGDGKEEAINYVVLIIWYHPACQDPEFVSVLLNRGISIRFASILFRLWESFPGQLHMNCVLLEKLLQYYGPHYTTSKPLQSYEHTIGKVSGSNQTFPGITALTLTDTQLSVPNSPFDEVINVFKHRYATPFVISRHSLAKFLSKYLFHYENKAIVMTVLQYIKTHQDFHELLGPLYVADPFSFSSPMLDLYGSNKELPLHYCVLYGWEDMVDIILEIQKPSNTSNNWTCAHIAAHTGRPSLLQKFVDMGQNINERTAEGYTVVHTTLLGLRYGCRVVETWSWKSNENFRYGIQDMYHVLFPGSEDFEKVFCIFLHIKADCFNNELIMEIDKFGNSIGHYLVIHNYRNILELLLEYNKDFAFQRNNSELPTTLHVAVYLGRPELVTALWEAGVRPKESELSLEETLDSGKKLSTKKIDYSQTNLFTCDSEAFFQLEEGKEKVRDIKLECIAPIVVEFGSYDDFHSVKYFLQNKHDL